MSDNIQKNMLEGKTALVTGGGRGIGRAMCEMLASRGANVVCNDPGVSVTGGEDDEHPAVEVVKAIEKDGGKAVANFDSVSDIDGAKAMVEQARDEFGTIDIVVNNAGILRDRIFHKMSPEEWKAVIDVHLNGTFNVSHFAGHIFKEQESGAFVHMTSTSGLIGNFGQANYSAAKLGIAALSKSIALDMMRYNVRSNCISPFAWSRMIGSIPNTPDQADRLERLQKMTPDKVAAMAVFLASDLAKDVSGQIFAVRGTEFFLMSQPRPIRSVHRQGGWTPESIAETGLPAIQSSLIPLERSGDVFSWDPPE